MFLEGGFDREGYFVHVSALDLAKLSHFFRSTTIAFFLERTLLNEWLGRNMPQWTHPGFRVDLSVKIAAASSRAREALAQPTARPPVSLKKMLVEEHASSALFRSEYTPYFRTDTRLFPATEFLVKVLHHLPDTGSRLIPWAAAGCAADSESPSLRAVFITIAWDLEPQASSAPFGP